MVNTHLYSSKPAISMIELIFSLVVMGIAISVAPSLVSQANKSTYVTTQQESISLLSSQMAVILSKHWDENNANNEESAHILLTSTASSVGLGPNLVNYVREGTPIIGIGHRVFLNSYGNTNVASSFGSFGNSADVDIFPNLFDDIDDYHQSPIVLKQASSSQEDDYIDKNIVINPNIYYMRDIPTNSTHYTGLKALEYSPNFNQTNSLSSNIKGIHLHLQDANKNVDTNTSTSTELQKDISLYAFSCNIGSYSFDEKLIP